MEKTNDLSDCIPVALVNEIRKNGKEQNNQHVYRVAKRGKISEIEFMGSYEETLCEGRAFKGDLNLIGSYSTSCYLSPKHPVKFLGFLKARLFKKYPCPIIIHGNTICGLSQLTKERIPDHLEEDHVDWWIYKGNFDKLLTAFSIADPHMWEGVKK